MQSVKYIREKTLNNNDDLCVIMSLTRIIYNLVNEMDSPFPTDK